LLKVQSVYEWFNWIKRAGAIISGTSIMAMMLIIFADVFSRNFLGGSITGVLEVVQKYLMPLAIFPGLAFVYASGIMPRMDLLIVKFNKGFQNVVVYLLLILELLIFTAVVYYSLEYAIYGVKENLSFSAGAALYPVYPILFLIPFGFLLLIIEIIFVIVINAMSGRPRFTVKDPAEITEGQL